MMQIIFTFVSLNLREKFIVLWNTQKGIYGGWNKAEGTSKLAQAIGCNKKFNNLHHETKKRITNGQLDKFDATCLFQIILNLDLFELEEMERKAIEKLKEIRNYASHSTDMDKFEEYKNKMEAAFKILKWDFSGVQEVTQKVGTPNTDLFSTSYTTAMKKDLT